MSGNLENVNSGKSQESGLVRRDDRGRFPAGVSGNLKGGPKGPKRAVAQLYKAIEKFKREEGVDFYHAALKLGWDLAKSGKTSLLETLIGRALPAQSQIEAEVGARPTVQMGDVILKDGTPLTFDVSDTQNLPGPVET